MKFTATVVEVLIASPSDTSDQRTTIWRAAVEWNVTYGNLFRTVLVPIRWEKDAYPDLSAPPQDVINRQLVDDADILIATFWTTLGTATANARSGTVEEIEKFLKANKQVFVYFCDMPAPPLDNDLTKLAALKEYRDELKALGLFGSYTTLEELEHRVREDLTKYFHSQGLGQVDATPPDDDAPSGSQGGTAPGKAQQLSELRDSLRGFVHEWETAFGGLEEDISIDHRYELAQTIQSVMLQLDRYLAALDADSALLQNVSGLAREAARIKALRVYLDGGTSFRALNGGLESLIAGARELVDLPWQPPTD